MINPFTFAMPGLSRYTFHWDGRVWSNSKLKFITLQDGEKFSPRYKLLRDDERFEWVRLSEILAYGNHSFQAQYSSQLTPVVYRPFILHRTRREKTIEKVW